VQSLLSITREGRVPHIHIRDAPRYEFRGMHIDVARNFFVKEEIFKLINVMAMYKMNKLHLHLTDDEGWRLEIPGIPELTKVNTPL
jgi:hexosaminidase